MGVFTTDIRIRFADCDPGGIAFYPRLVEKLQQTIERWFESAIGFDFNQIHMINDWGMPIVHLDCEFLNPTRLSETLTFTLWLEKIGRTSYIVRQEVTCGDEIRAKARMVLVMRSFNKADKIEIPPEFRAKMQDYLKPPEKAGA